MSVPVRIADTHRVSLAAQHPAERVAIDTDESSVTVICLICDGQVTIDLHRLNDVADGFEQFVHDHRNC